MANKSPQSESVSHSSGEISGAPSPSRVRLDFLDGMRGMAALYVMIGHLRNFIKVPAVNDSHSITAACFSFAMFVLSFNHLAVAVFIVLSGFCLMLPVAKSSDLQLAGGVQGFILRRAKRILPPYYAALFISVALLKLSHSKQDVSVPNVVFHIFMIHNLFNKYHSGLDGPMWSIAPEWQIYFIFALVLLPIWRKLGIAATVFVAFLLSFLPLILLPERSNFHWTCPWYLGLFSLGMLAAIAWRSNSSKLAMFKNNAMQSAALATLAAAILAILTLDSKALDAHVLVVDCLMGMFASAHILACCSGNNSAFVRWSRAFLSARISMILGAFSYSLYLTHDPIMGKIAHTVIQHGYSGFKELVILLFTCIPVCLVVAYGFHLLFERPFMPGRPQTEKAAEVAAIVSPAP